MCGDGNLDDSFETCDDGNTNSLDGCASDCTSIESGWTCTTTNGTLSVCTAICGDGKVVATETCDDGDTDNTSKCKSDCSGNVSGWSCTGGSTSSAST